MEKKYLKMLDILLRYYKRCDGKNIHPESMQEFNYLKHQKELGFSDNQIAEMKEMLREDKFIRYDNIKTYNVITLKGILYEGYTQQKQDTKLNRKVQRIHHWILSIGTIGMGLYSIIEIIKFVYSYCILP